MSTPHISGTTTAVPPRARVPMNAVTDLGTHGWVDRTGGQLTSAERRSLLRPLARTHMVNAVGRLSMLAGLNSGRRVQIDPARLLPPSTALTRAAVEQAQHLLTPALLNHSYRTFAFGAALGALEGLTVDTELLFAAALLHDTGLPTHERNVDFTRSSARIAQDVAEEVGLSSAATETMRTAITLHYSPRVPLTDGPVAYLLAAGAGLDVVGMRSWQLPPRLLASVAEQHPRLGFTGEFAAAFRAEAARVPRGRAQFLRRYGAFDLAIKLSPFRD
jgi:HD domain